MKPRIWYDAEFVRCTHGPRLISLGMVREDGAKLYAINANMPLGPISRNPWLMANVVPHLPLRTGGRGAWDRGHPDFEEHVLTEQQIAQQVASFIDGLGETVQLWSWCAGQDHHVLTSLWRWDWDAYPLCMPTYTADLQQELDRLGLPGSKVPPPRNLSKVHHALFDAEHHRDISLFLDEFEADALEALRSGVNGSRLE